MTRRPLVSIVRRRSRSNRQTGKALHTQQIFGSFANGVARFAGNPMVSVAALAVIVVWALTGPIFHYSDTWQLVINTGTSVVTFLMVFLIQNSQNRDSAAIQVKLDELIRVSSAQNKFVGIERLSDTEIEQLRVLCQRRAGRGSETERRVDHKAKDAADRST